ncbi:hypothetical protein [Bradyrhizobium sp. Ash2021]|uniref:hypothetical protein n=1 Tax=Bradyrhizobium sp. Ash2021 TaxID=2954771 RepID=UPI002815B97C|nr:hypothetical protein [Bradyrhizobium sp. Ash2021]WMT72027.1 hypothetical protein NL528_28675 [Bradyrhizobium sp. Ash2021]
MTLSALFVAAADRWAVEEPAARPRAVERDGIILSDFDNPLELKVETIAVAGRVQNLSAVDQSIVTEQVREVTADITAELARLLEEQAVSRLSNGAKDDPDLHQRNRS